MYTHVYRHINCRTPYYNGLAIGNDIPYNNYYIIITSLHIYIYMYNNNCYIYIMHYNCRTSYYSYML